MNIISTNGIHTISFKTNAPITHAVELVIRLLKDKITNSQVITQQDIIEQYCQWREKNCRRPHFFIDEWGYCEALSRNAMLRNETTKEEFITSKYAWTLAKAWFKNNLAGAIIAGKLLVIPIIEIDE